MMIDDFLHVSITCRDLERSVRFYETLGLQVIQRLGEVNEDGIARGFQLPAGRLAVAYLAPSNASSSMFIDLVQWLEPPSTGEPYPVLNHVGLNRIAFRVSDLEATTAALQEQGITFLTREPQVFGEGIRCIVTTDPDGVFIQLIEGL
jgi:catechol 2,3-dioxygenase-like lactoylglutathione lyase family enzyme